MYICTRWASRRSRKARLRTKTPKGRIGASVPDRTPIPNQFSVRLDATRKQLPHASNNPAVHPCMRAHEPNYRLQPIACHTSILCPVCKTRPRPRGLFQITDCRMLRWVQPHQGKWTILSPVSFSSCCRAHRSSVTCSQHASAFGPCPAPGQCGAVAGCCEPRWQSSSHSRSRAHRCTSAGQGETQMNRDKHTHDKPLTASASSCHSARLRSVSLQFVFKLPHPLGQLRPGPVHELQRVKHSEQGSQKGVPVGM